LTRSESGHATIRVRITDLPEAGEFDEYDLTRFAVGEVYDVTAQLASLLIIAGYADPIPFSRWSDAAADSNRLRKR
jgi:hypothetical protein